MRPRRGLSALAAIFTVAFNIHEISGVNLLIRGKLGNDGWSAIVPDRPKETEVGSIKNDHDQMKHQKSDVVNIFAHYAKFLVFDMNAEINQYDLLLFTSSLGATKVLEGENVMLACLIDSHYTTPTHVTTPRVTWARAGSEMTILGTGSTFTIRNVRDGDFGVYICTLSVPGFQETSAEFHLMNKACTVHNCAVCEDNSTCTRCMRGHGHNEGRTICTACTNPHCSDCDAPGDCFICSHGYDLTVDNNCDECTVANCKYCKQQNECELCSDGYGKDNKGKCIACTDENCQGCQYDYKNCDFCHEPYNLDDEGNCEACTIENCNECHLGECLSCNAGYGLDGIGNCIGCDVTNCSICGSDYESCEVCDWHFCRADCQHEHCGTCVLGDPDTFTYDGRCSACGDNCIRCSHNYVGYHSHCLECEDGYALNDEHTCTACPENCSECRWDYSVGELLCQTCQEGYDLDDNNNCAESLQLIGRNENPEEYEDIHFPDSQFIKFLH